MGKDIDGKRMADRIRKELKRKVSLINPKPCLAVIQAGNNPASEVYVRIKQKACEETGIISKKYSLPGSTSEKDLVKIIRKLNTDRAVNGILVQLPLPVHISEKNVLSAIAPEKDVDCFHPINVGRLAIGEETFAPCTPAGIIALIESVTRIEGRHTVIVGRSNIVGKPLALLLLQKNATVTVCHSKTKSISDHTRKADILVSAVGRPGLITRDMVKKGAVVIDVGTTKIREKIMGDVDYISVKKVASHITPVPGGVGPMTVATLIQNTLKAALLQKKQKK